MTITQEQADKMLQDDLKKFEADVRRICNYLELNQNQFDALVSFTYNCGSGNLIKLTKNQTRNAKEISDHIEAYNKGANNQVLAGLVRRRKEEKELFLMEEKELTLAEKLEEIKKCFGFDDNTCNYFLYYRYGAALIEKLYEKTKKGEK